MKITAKQILPGNVINGRTVKRVTNPDKDGNVRIKWSCGGVTLYHPDHVVVV